MSTTNRSSVSKKKALLASSFKRTNNDRLSTSKRTNTDCGNSTKVRSNAVFVGGIVFGADTIARPLPRRREIMKRRKQLANVYTSYNTHYEFDGKSGAVTPWATLLRSQALSELGNKVDSSGDDGGVGDRAGSGVRSQTARRYRSNSVMETRPKSAASDDGRYEYW
jgi:hypothetical protein